MAGVHRLERGEINGPLKNVLIGDDHIDRHKGAERHFGARIKSYCWTHRVLWRFDKVTFEVKKSKESA